jgi:hypothetical protein
MYNYPRPIYVKIEKVVGFILFLIGIFSLLKLLNILDVDLIVPSEYLAWFTAGVCVFFGLILVLHKQHGIS